MGYYCAWGDAKMVCSSEEEGYDNRASDVGQKRGRRASDTHGEANDVNHLKPSVPASPISDDTDRQFWAEDELSSSESRQRLNTRRKRRHSVSYRNRAANKSLSRAPRSSNSSSDSIHVEILPKIRKTRRRWLHSKTKKLQSVKASCTSTEKTDCAIEVHVSSEHQTASTSSSRLEDHKTNLLRTNHCKQSSHTLRNNKKTRMKKAYGSSKSKQK